MNSCRGHGLQSLTIDLRCPLQERVKAWQQWQNATATLTKKREAKAKAELAGKVERVGQLRQEIAEQERQQEMAQDNFDRCVVNQ